MGECFAFRVGAILNIFPARVGHLCERHSAIGRLALVMEASGLVLTYLEQSENVDVGNDHLSTRIRLPAI